MRDRAIINVSGADGGGSSLKIYETPDYHYPFKGACVMHGSFCAGPTSPDSQRIEVVELHMPCIDIRVKADDVRAELKALKAELRPYEVPTDNAPRAFDALVSSVVGLVGRHITVAHIETIVSAAFRDGVRNGRGALQDEFCTLLGVR